LIPENKGWPKFESRKLRFFKAFLIYLPNVLPALAEPTWKLFYCRPSQRENIVGFVNFLWKKYQEKPLFLLLL
jgi:hypothetical protein